MMALDRPPSPDRLLLDLTILSDPGLFSAWLFLASSTGRQVVCLSDDEQTLTWLAAGHVVECVYSEHFTELDNFHLENRESLKALVPSNPRLDSPVASLSLLDLAIDRGWVQMWGGRGTMPDYFATAYLGLTQDELRGLRSWDGSVFEYLWERSGHEGPSPQPYEYRGVLPLLNVDYDRSEERVATMAAGAWKEIRIGAPDTNFRTQLVDLEESVNGESLLWNDVSIRNPDADPVLRVRLAQSLRASLGFVLEGTAEHVTNSATYARFLKTSLRQAPQALAGRRLGKERSIASRFQTLRPGARVEDVAELIDSARRVELLADVLGLAPPTLGAELRTLGSQHALGMLPQPLRLLAGLVQLGIRRRRGR